MGGVFHSEDSEWEKKVSSIVPAPGILLAIIVLSFLLDVPHPSLSLFSCEILHTPMCTHFLFFLRTFTLGPSAIALP